MPKQKIIARLEKKLGQVKMQLSKHFATISLAEDRGDQAIHDLHKFNDAVRKAAHLSKKYRIQ